MSKAIEARPPRGMRDLLPGDMRRKDYVCGVLRDVFRSHGFEPLDTPALESRTTLEGKYGPDAERLIYGAGLRDDDSLALRYDLSVPLARVAATSTDLPLPFRRYQISKVWRGERPQRGRYREITQADIDIVGAHDMLADAEIITIVVEALGRLGFSGNVTKINNRKILEALGRYAGVPEALLPGLYRSIDKLDKVGLEGVRLELRAVGLPAELVNRARQSVERWLRGTADADRLRADLVASVPDGEPAELTSQAIPVFVDSLAAYVYGEGLELLSSARQVTMSAGIDAMRRTYPPAALVPDQVTERLLDLLTRGGESGELLDRFAVELSGAAAIEGVDEMKAVLSALDASDLPAGTYGFDPAMVRGLEYYTGTIFETVVTDPPIGSITGGGRYDGLVGLFGRSLPAVGTSLGVDRLVDVMTEHDLFPRAMDKPVAEVLVARSDAAQTDASLTLAARLRREGLRAEMYVELHGLGDQIGHAAKRGIPIVAIVGPDEATAQSVTLRDMSRQQQRTVAVLEAAAAVRAMLADI